MLNLEDDDLKVREILLNYYSTECTVHGGYILTTAIGIFAFFQVAKFVGNSFIINALVLSMFATVSLYLVARTIFWGVMASCVIHEREISEEEAKKRLNDYKITSLLRLHVSCLDHFVSWHNNLNFLVRVRKDDKRSWTLYGSIFVAFSVLLLIAFGSHFRITI